MIQCLFSEGLVSADRLCFIVTVIEKANSGFLHSACTISLGEKCFAFCRAPLWSWEGGTALHQIHYPVENF